jgi:hypothetical protein
MWCRKNDPRRGRRALRAFQRQLVFRHRPHLCERTAAAAEIFIDRHRLFLEGTARSGSCRSYRARFDADRTGEEVHDRKINVAHVVGRVVVLDEAAGPIVGFDNKVVRPA